jgi:hypothetical protein
MPMTNSALEELVVALPEFDHLVSMVGDTMAGGFLQTPLDTMRHVLHSKFWTNLLIARFAAPLIRDGGSMTFTSGSGVRARKKRRRAMWRTWRSPPWRKDWVRNLAPACV